MAEIERTEHGDSGRARAWTLRAVRALHDPAWTADGYVSDRWRPVSPVTGRLDAFQWQTPVAALPSDKNTAIESSAFEEAMLAPPRVAPPGPPPADVTSPPSAQDNSPPGAPASAPVPPAPAIAAPPPASATPEPAPPPPSAESAPVTSAPLFRARSDLGKPALSVPPVIPIIRPPDDPGIDEDAPTDEFAEPVTPVQGQAGGWRGFLSRWGG
jgi:HemY protein